MPPATQPPAVDPRTFAARFFEEGRFVFREGDPPSCAYIVESGRIEIHRGQGAHRRLLGTILPGGIFGEMALIDNEPRMADAVAAVDSVCKIVSPDLFHDKLAKADPFVRALLRILVRNVRSMAEMQD
ncbi:MAG TPA: cyclic nucleotide-binding domain-containing protein [Azospirillum sp.]